MASRLGMTYPSWSFPFSPGLFISLDPNVMIGFLFPWPVGAIVHRCPSSSSSPTFFVGAGWDSSHPQVLRPLDLVFG